MREIIIYCERYVLVEKSYSRFAMEEVDREVGFKALPSSAKDVIYESLIHHIGSITKTI